jgi:hypothetical protein
MPIGEVFPNTLGSYYNLHAHIIMQLLAGAPSEVFLAPPRWVTCVLIFYLPSLSDNLSPLLHYLSYSTARVNWFLRCKK